MILKKHFVVILIKQVLLWNLVTMVIDWIKNLNLILVILTYEKVKELTLIKDDVILTNAIFYWVKLQILVNIGENNFQLVKEFV